MNSLPPSTVLLEAAWEVCNQIGGIYTVLRSKAAAMVERWGDRYIAVGPLMQDSMAIEFQPEASHDPVVAALVAKGHPLYVGRWEIPGRPRTILIDFRAGFSALDLQKYLLWERHGIQTATGDSLVNDSIAFGYCLANLLRDLVALQRELVSAAPPSVICHMHEWMAGVASLLLHQERLPLRTVFTTHATLLGRYIATNDPLFIHRIGSIDPSAEASRYSIGTPCAIERAAAHCCDQFSTISDVTAAEATRFLDREPTAITPNGINIERFTALHEFQNLHLRYKQKIHDFVRGHFFPSYIFDLDKTLYFFISGRYEYRNKGMDIFIEAIHRLNGLLRQSKDPVTVVAFIITKGATKHISVDALQSHLMYDDLKAACRDLASDMGDRLLRAVVEGKLPSYEELLVPHSQVRLRRAMHAFRRSGLPRIVTHDVVDDGGDPILRHLRERQLFNAPSDPVKVVFHPGFITPTSPLFGLEYEQFVRGCHLGVFPSAYEPWGYTPLECLATGIPTVTTDLAGFGRFVQDHIPGSDRDGVYVLNRSTTSDYEAAERLAGVMHEFCKLSRRGRIELRNRVERLGQQFDWSILAEHYHRLHDQAIAG
jgi:glycogen(starch) synthase